jgi:CDP-diacylglycerol--glycerol-3-phosphate 3-phosphatidyltransferase
MNLPNKLTVLRIVFIPILMFFYLNQSFEYGKLIAGVIFLIAISTDFLDGYIARKYNLVTDSGKFLDPIADKLIVTAGLLLVVADATIPNPYGVIALFVILAREFIVAVLRQMAANKNVVIAADNLGKLKTIMQDVAIVFLFLLAFNNQTNTLSSGIESALSIASFTILGLSVFLTILSGFNYIFKNQKIFK